MSRNTPPPTRGTGPPSASPSMQRSPAAWALRGLFMGAGGIHEHQPVRITIGRRRKEHAFDQTEDRRGGPIPSANVSTPECESGLFTQHPGAKSKSRSMEDLQRRILHRDEPGDHWSVEKIRDSPFDGWGGMAPCPAGSPAHAFVQSRETWGSQVLTPRWRESCPSSTVCLTSGLDVQTMPFNDLFATGIQHLA